MLFFVEFLRWFPFVDFLSNLAKSLLTFITASQPAAFIRRADESMNGGLDCILKTQKFSNSIQKFHFDFVECVWMCQWKNLERKQPLISIKHRKTVKWGKNGLFVHSPHIIADLTNPLRKCIEKKSHLILITNYELSPLLSTSTAIKYLYIFHSFTVRQFSPITRFHHDFFLLRVSITATINCSFSTFNGFNGIEVVEEARKFKWIANIRRWTESSASPFCVVLSTPSKKNLMS